VQSTKKIEEIAHSDKNTIYLASIARSIAMVLQY